MLDDKIPGNALNLDRGWIWEASNSTSQVYTACEMTEFRENPLNLDQGWILETNNITGQV